MAEKEAHRASATEQEYWEVERGYRYYDHPVVEAFMSQRLGYIRSWLDLTQIETALDVGCGNGFSTYYVSKFIPNCWAIDTSARMLQRHPFRRGGRISQADGMRLPFPDDCFDLVYAWEVLHHIPQPHLALAEMRRVSRHYVLTAEPNRDQPLLFIRALLVPARRHILPFSSRYLKQQFEKAGLTVVHSGRGGWLFPNATPLWMLPLLRMIPYRSFLGITNWVLGRKDIAD
jgi:SAM-dependent methyltransferase